MAQAQPIQTQPRMASSDSKSSSPTVRRTQPPTRPLSSCIDHGRHHDIDRLQMSPSSDILFYDPRSAHLPAVSTATAGRPWTHKRRTSTSARSVVTLGRSGSYESMERAGERSRNAASLHIQAPKFAAPIIVPQGRVVEGIDEKMVVPDSTPEALKSCASTDKEFLLPMYEQGNQHRRPGSPFLISLSSWQSTLKTVLFGLVFLLAVLQFILKNPLSSTVTHNTQSPVFQQQEREFAKIANKCYGLPGITAPTYLDRLDTLQKTLNKIKEHDDGRRQIWMSEPSATSAYFTSISRSEWSLSERPFLFIVESSHENGSGADLKIFTPQFEEDRARILPLFGIPAKELPASWAMDRKKSQVETVMKGDSVYTIEYIAWQEDQSPYAVLSEYLESTSPLNNPKEETVQIHLDPGVRAFISSGLAHELDSRKHHGVYIDVADHEILGIREKKSLQEIELLECANHFTLQAIRRTREKIEIGMTESKVGSILREEFRAVGMPDGEGLVLFGENAALPHGSGTDRVLTDRDLVLIDAGGTFRGYVADVTRTFALKDAHLSDDQIRLWNIVQSAQKAAIKAAVEKGATGHSIDEAARKLINHRGSKPEEKSGLTHRLGHGIGLEGHESPYLVGSNYDEVAPGNTFSNEPGIYIPGQVGIRLEDCWYLHEGIDGKRTARMLTGPAVSPLIL